MSLSILAAVDDGSSTDVTSSSEHESADSDTEAAVADAKSTRPAVDRRSSLSTLTPSRHDRQPSGSKTPQAAGTPRQGEDTGRSHGTSQAPSAAGCSGQLVGTPTASGKKSKPHRRLNTKDSYMQAEVLYFWF